VVIGKSVKHKFLSDLHPDYLNKVLYLLELRIPGTGEKGEANLPLAVAELMVKR
jgi:hypothetical protein